LAIGDLLSGYAAKIFSPREAMEDLLTHIDTAPEHNVWITRLSRTQVLAYADALSARSPQELPLYGVPFAIKDNIDLAGIPTTAACPDFAYTPAVSATVVQKLIDAGAIPIGKTNLDQFATGLVGTRTPYPVPRNPLRGDLIPGGSSSGSAVAVAAGIVPIALGTDTAGSGRVPAMLNNIVGIKPSLGLVSTRGVVPACRTLDCVSVFAADIDDAWTALTAIAGYDTDDPYSRKRSLGTLELQTSGYTLGVPRMSQRLFFGDTRASLDYGAALARLSRLGYSITEIDIEPFFETARLLYEGPWVAERYLAARRIIETQPDALHPVTREIIAGGAKPRATEAFEAFYRLEELRRVAAETFRQLDALALPTAPTVYTCEQVLADPIRLNTRLGTYTNFVNLLDLCGVAVPAVLHADHTPFGVTFLAPAGKDAVVASIARQFHADTGLSTGAAGAGHAAEAVAG
jgi:allophanate hydrolase